MSDLPHQNLKHMSPKEWRQWLELNHLRSEEIWLKFYKKDTGLQILSYEEAVNEAICFGWIESKVKRIDNQSYAYRFTPRNKTSKWSETNKIRALKLIENGKMTKAGFDKINWLKEP